MSASADMVAEVGRRLAVFVDTVEPSLITAGAILEAEMRRRAGLDDHTLKELARLGHPYRQAQGETIGHQASVAERWARGGPRGLFGQIGTKWVGGQVTKTGQWRAGILKKARQAREIFALGHDIKLVHMQSTDLVNAIVNERERTDDYILVRVGVDPSKLKDPRIIEYIIKGTRKMIPRDFIGMAVVAARSAVLATVRAGINAGVHAAGMVR